MNSKKIDLLIIGSLPPPFIGPYIATQKLIDSKQTLFLRKSNVFAES